MRTQTEIRKAFWETFPEYVRKHGATQNDYNATIRSAFVEFVDDLQKSGQISEGVASRVTL